MLGLLGHGVGWPDDGGRRTKISCGREVDGCVWFLFLTWCVCRMKIYVGCRVGGGGAGRKHVLEIFGDVSVDKMAFLCFLF